MRRLVAALLTVGIAVAALFGAAVVVATPAATAATSGWYVATVPGTAQTTSRSAQPARTAPVLGRRRQLDEPWRWQPAVRQPTHRVVERLGVDARHASVAGGRRWRVVRRHVRQRVRLLGRRRARRIRRPESDGHPHRALGRHAVVGGPEPHSEWSRRGRCLPQRRELRVSHELFAVGYATDANGNNLTDVIEQWNGSTWNIVPGAATGQAFDELTGIQCLSADNCWAVGNAGPAQQMSNFLPVFPGAVGDQGLIEHWDGSAWSIVPSVSEPAPNGGYLSRSRVRRRERLLGIGGDDRRQRDGVRDPHGTLGRLDVDRRVGVGPALRRRAFLSGISCVSAVQCWAAGSTGSFNNGGSGAQLQSLVEYWNGSSWSAVSPACFPAE